MFGSDILEVATGVVFVFVLLSTICTSVREGLEGWFKTRASYLEFGIRELLQDRKGDGLAKELFNHPLIFGLYAGDYTPGSTKRPGVMTSGGNLPTYIPSRSFARALMDIAARGPVAPGAAPGADATTPANGQPLSMAQIRANAAKIPNPAVRRVLITAIDSAQGDFDQACAHIEHWYDSAMDRVSGWYKRSTQWALFWIALVISIGLNVNTITLSDYLYRHDAERSAIVSTIDKTAATPATAGDRYATAKSELEQLRLPMGWSDGWGAPRTRAERGYKDKPVTRDNLSYWQDVGAPILGWLLTAFAAMLGAPFWFDVLNQIMVIRSTVKPHEKSGEEASMDRQPQPAPQSPVVVTASPRMTVAELSERDDPCGVGNAPGTPDDQLPPARGGVA